jgi:hypothetical protein
MKNLKRISFLFAISVLVLASASLSVAEEKWAKLDNAKIHYVSEGKGKEAVVLVHGWTCNLGHWRDQIPELSKRARVIALDLPGHGMSDKPDTNYSMDYFAAAIDAVMKDAGVERAVHGHACDPAVLPEVSAEDSGAGHCRWWVKTVWHQGTARAVYEFAAWAGLQRCRSADVYGDDGDAFGS